MRTTLDPKFAATLEGQAADEVLRACVHCGMCNATCPTFQLTGDELDGPRGRIYLMKQVLEGQKAGPITQDHLDACLTCRACETTCPSGVEYHRLLDVGREVVARQVPRPWPERFKRWALRQVAAHPGRLRPLMALGRAFRFALPASLAAKLKAPPPAPSMPARQHVRRMTQLGGCVQPVAAPHFNAVTARVFDACGISLGEAPGAGCCGALSFHLDAQDEARAFARRNIDAWIGELDAGSEAIVVNASGCAAFIADYPDLLRGDPAYADKARRVAAALRDPIQVLEDADLPATAAPAHPRIAVHEPCTLQHGLRLPGRIGRLLTRLGYQPQPVADAHLCCGSAGAYSLLRPDMAEPLRAAKVAALNAHSPSAVYTANIGCWMHLGETSPAPVRHWLEAVDDLIGPAA
ncbi:glycolate oxidase subunit GlcF [Caulobacter sp. KR2-114]|uniref:glycolate oxidase subunit GlcF n=1 Tax=Caulobacter sp. KR2-114 TaxID=3400912 RepID=UPI003C09E027